MQVGILPVPPFSVLYVVKVCKKCGCEFSYRLSANRRSSSRTYCWVCSPPGHVAGKIPGKICKKCGCRFTHKCGNRVYCLNCSPVGFKAGNLPHLRGAIRKCCRCVREYPYERDSGHGWTRCNSCIVNSRRGRVRHKAIRYKGGKCVVCGYAKMCRSLVFHHLDPSDKDFEVSSSTASLSWERIKSELDKCILVCANCHGEIHDGLTAV